MTQEDLEKIFEETESKWEGDNALEGLLILRKYFDNNKNVLCGADHDIIYSVDIHEAMKNGLTKEDVIKLAKLNWMIEDGYFACFV